MHQTLIAMVAKVLKHRHKWRVVKTIWPYPHGYGTHCRGCNTVLDTGQTKRGAQALCRQLNKEEGRG